MTLEKRSHGWLFGALTVVMVLAAAPSVEAGGRGPRPGTTTSKRPKGKYPYLGNPNARVTIEVFGDFQCPFTQRLAPTLPKLAKVYPKKVKIIWRDFPLRFHKRAMPAAIAAREVFRQRGTKGFMIIGTKIFSNARSLTDANLVTWASLAGANAAKVRSALTSAKYRAAIKAEMRTAKGRGVRGTPTILINGNPHKGGRTLTAFKRVIDAL
jgi:protein-disulfide isomerase